MDFLVKVTRQYAIAAESAAQARQIVEEHPELWDSVVVGSTVEQLHTAGSAQSELPKL
jgi:hypothetical protein